MNYSPLIAGMLAILGLTACQNGSGPRVSYAEARAVVDRRCVECHSAHPTSKPFPFAPQGVMLDTAPQMKQYAARILARVVVEQTMPIVNMSGMTPEERAILGRWVQSGAKIP